MELGFTHNFFVELLRRHGWRVAELHVCAPSGRGNVYTARRLGESAPASEAPLLSTQPSPPPVAGRSLSFS